MNRKTPDLEHIDVSFVVRCWGQEDDGDLCLRGELHCVQSAEKKYFRDLSQLPQLIQEQIRSLSFDIRRKR